ncbi:MAG: tetratricopeptide repeat protein, partial [candidate division Zixibacteria bacterium]|nr:tetratricopeptide repeat protein [candidate division Zixibacteria bacterium]
INNLAHVQFKQGKIAEASKNYRRAIALKPNFAPPYNNLGLIMWKKQQNYDSALTLFSIALDRYDPVTTLPEKIAQIHLNRADVFETTRQFDSASAAYYNAMMSGLGKTFRKAAAFYARIGMHQYTDSLFKRARHLQDLTAVDQFNWGLSFMERKLYSEGVLKMRLALKIDPTLYQAWYCIAVTYYEMDESRDSVDYYLNQCLDLAPEYPAAVDLNKLLDKGKN